MGDSNTSSSLNVLRISPSRLTSLSRSTETESSKSSVLCSTLLFRPTTPHSTKKALIDWWRPFEFVISILILPPTANGLARHARGKGIPGPADIAWSILESNPLPEGMTFVQDEKSKNHYFLAVVDQPMHISTLISNLRTIARKMAIVTDISYGDR